MSEDAPLIPEEQLHQPNVGDTLVPQKPDIGLGDNYETNLPEGVNIFTEVDTEFTSGDRRPYEGVNPGTLDELPAGEYFIKGHDPTKANDHIIDGQTGDIERSLEIIVQNDGKYLSSKNQIGDIHPQGRVEARPLLEKVGFIFSEEDTLIPTPATVEKRLQEEGIDAELYSDTGHIPSEVFVKAYRDGKYPIATGEESYYQHDIEDDHITGVVLGGPELMAAISTALETVISEDGRPLVSKDEIGAIANGIDRFTSALRSVTAPFNNVPDEFLYSKEMGRKTLHEKGAAVGLAASVVDDILAVAQKRASEIGIQTREIT